MDKTPSRNLHIFPSWRRSLSLGFLALVLTITLGLILNTSVVAPTVTVFLTFTGLVVLIVMLTALSLLDILFLRNLSYVLSDKGIQVRKGKAITDVPFSHIQSMWIFGWFVRLASGGKVGHLALRLDNGKVIRLEHIPNVREVTKAILSNTHSLQGRKGIV